MSIVRCKHCPRLFDLDKGNSMVQIQDHLSDEHGVVSRPFDHMEKPVDRTDEVDLIF